MSHKLLRFSESIFSQPQLITLEKYQEIADFLDNRNIGGIQDDFKMFFNSENGNKADYADVVNGIGTLSINGPISAKPTGWEALCGGVNYPDLKTTTDNLISKGAKVIFMDVDSGGGSAHLCFETSRAIRDKADKAGVKLIAYVNGSSGSAAYALTSVAHEVYANETSKVGSIGVVVALTDDSKRMHDAGVKRKFITSTNGKVPLTDEGNFKESFLNSLQEDVDKLHQDFLSHVSTYRKQLTTQQIDEMQSQMFRAEVALEKGLIDGVMEVDQFNDYLISLVNKTNNSVGKHNNGASMSIENENLSTEIVEENLESEVVEETLETVVTEESLEEAVEVVEEAATEAVVEPNLSAEMAQMKEQMEQLQAQLQSAEKAKQEAATELRNKQMSELVSKAEMWGFAGVDAQTFASHAIEGSVPVEMFENALVKAQAALEISNGMQELGMASEETPKAEEKVDGVEAALAAKGVINK